MQSLGLKINAIQNPFDLKSIGKSQWIRILHRKPGIIACSSTDDGGGVDRNGNGNGRDSNSFFSRRETYSLLKQQLSVAARFEVSFSVIDRSIIFCFVLFCF